METKNKTDDHKKKVVSNEKHGADAKKKIDFSKKSPQNKKKKENR